MDKSQGELPEEYKRLYKKQDLKIFGTLESLEGPLLRAIKQQHFCGLGVGDQSEVSKNMTDLVRMLATFGAKKLMGDLSVPSFKRTVSAMVRISMERLSCLAWKFKARAILDRSRYVGLHRRDFSQSNDLEYEDSVHFENYFNPEVFKFFDTPGQE